MPLTRRHLFDSITSLSLLGAAGIGAYHELKSNIIMASGNQKAVYDPSLQIGPNEAQMSFLRHISDNYDFIALGDTNHGHAEINLYALNANLLGIFSAAGKLNYFIERYPSSAPLLQQEAVTSPDFQTKCQEELIPSYIVSEQAITDLCNQWRNAVGAHPAIEFTPVDHRPGGFFSSWLSVLIERYALDDTKAFDDIEERAHSGTGGVIFYGAGHFKGMHDWHGNPIDMRTLIEKAGYSIFVVNIFKDDEARRNRNRDGKPADADFTIFPNASNPSGIYENTDAGEQDYALMP